MSTDRSDPVSSSVRQLISLFENSLSDVRFPDVDLASLHARSLALHERARELTEAEDRVATARHAVDDARRELRKHADQALAYLQVYAEGRPDVRKQLETLELAKGERSLPLRPRKNKSSAAEPDLATNELPEPAFTKDKPRIVGAS